MSQSEVKSGNRNQQGNQQRRPWVPREQWLANKANQNPPTYTRATKADTPPVEKKEPIVDELIAQIKALSPNDSDKLLEQMIAAEPKEEGHQESGF